MNYFIQGDNFNRDGGKAEEKVWGKFKEAFSKREVLGYSRYPLFTKVGEKRKEPDILLLDKELGIIVLEVKGFTIEDIENIEANQWIIRNGYERTINPLGQVEDYLFAIGGKFDVDRELRRKYNGRAIVVLPNIRRDQWNKKGFNKALEYAPILFEDDLSKATLLNKIKGFGEIIRGQELNAHQYSIALSILGHEKNHIEDDIDNEFPKETKGNICKMIKGKLYELDLQQETLGKTIPPGPQRIRGIAGSGKTVVLCQKAAYMHLKYPEWKIAVVFFTQSLYDNIISTIDMYLRAFSNGDVKYDENSNLMIMHAWGRNKKTGFYKEIATKNNCKFRSVNNVKSELKSNFVNPSESINYISKKLLEEKNGNLERIFDAVLIDEGQDLVCDNHRYEGKQAFYYMAYKSLKPVSNDEMKMRRLIWAYDELQSLSTRKIPTGKEIFEDATLVQGIYKGGIKKSEIMKKCYRTPHSILTTAHAIGMGFFRENGMLSGYTTKEDWKNIGYEVVVGDFRKEGSEIKLRRPLENSPNPINDNCIEFKTYNSESIMLEELSNDIYNDINKHKLSPHKDVLVISLKEHDYKNQYLKSIMNYLNDKSINCYVPGTNDINKVDKQSENPEVFWKNNSVTISKVLRAKGNEASMVYVLGLEEIAKNENNIDYRNKLFVALTRAKCWVKVKGVGSYSLYDELKKSINSNGDFTFKYKKRVNESNDLEG